MPDYRKIKNYNPLGGNLEIRVLGDLDTIDSFMNLGPKLKSTVVLAQNVFMKKFLSKLKENLSNGGVNIGIIENSGSYLAKKIENTRDPMSNMPGYMVGNLRASIKLFRDRYGIASVGIKKGTPRTIQPPKALIGQAAAQEVTVDEYADFLERGTSKIPARPFIKNTYKQLGGNRGLIKFLNRSIAQRIRRLK